MKKDTIRAIMAAAIVMVMYLLIVLLIPFEHTPAYWISFAFCFVGFLVVAASFYIAFLREPQTQSRFYGFPVAKIGTFYGIAQLVLSLLFMALGMWIPLWIVVLLQALLMGAALLGLISAEATVDQIQTLDKKLKQDVTMMRSLQSRVNVLASQCPEPSAAKIIGKLAEELRYSDPVSNDAVSCLERDLWATVDQLQSAVVDGEYPAVVQLCRNASVILAERNRLCKLNKR